MLSSTQNLLRIGKTIGKMSIKIHQNSKKGKTFLMEFVPLPYFQSKSKCVLNDLELPETRLPHVLKSVTKTVLVPPPTKAKNITLF